MKVVGLITEYNPFHNGHKYHIEQAKKLTGADHAVVVMSGNYVQRGTPAVTDKYTRTKMALSSGADLVIELPVCYATASAEIFAYGAVRLLESLGIVDCICFGSECGDIKILTEIASMLVTEPESYQLLLNDLLKAGDSFPVARAKALSHLLKDDRFITVLQSPNNILGIEYIKALLNIGSNMEPYTITRHSSGYHSSSLEESAADDVISSASAIRNYVSENDDLLSLNKHIPIPSLEHLLLAKDKTFPMEANDFSLLLYYKLASLSAAELTSYLDITPDLAQRIDNLKQNYLSFEEFAGNLKSKNITHTRATRMLLHILLDIKESYVLDRVVPYIRILGVKKSSTHLLRTATKQCEIPIITKLADAKDKLNEEGNQMLSLDINAAHLYNEVAFIKFGHRMKDEYRYGIILL